MIYLTGDTHGDFQRIAHFCARMHTKPSDIVIILGDAGINFYGGWRDLHKKEFISALPITLFCIHGNHEQRPATIPSYTEQEWHGGTVYVEEQFPSILFAKDGEVYDLNGMQTIAIGGAYSIDWMLRIPGRSWWPDEQPSTDTKACVESKLDQLGWKVDCLSISRFRLVCIPDVILNARLSKEATTSIWTSVSNGMNHLSASG